MSRRRSTPLIDESQRRRGTGEFAVERVYAWSRPPTDEDGEGTLCEAMTPGCSIDHTRDRGSCEPW